MPGKQIKNWAKYHALRRKGMSKRMAAATTNKHPGRKKRRSKRR